MNVSAIIVTRGDCDLQPILESLPEDWDRVVWDNSRGVYVNGMKLVTAPARDLTVYGRYAAIGYASHDLIYVQDDDCIVSDPQAIVEEWERQAVAGCGSASQGSVGSGKARFGGPWLGQAGHGEVWWPGLVANQPSEFRHAFYEHHCLVGFGGVFHRDAPARAFRRFYIDDFLLTPHFLRTCDIVFTGLTPRVLVDVPVESLPYAHDDNRMWRQPTHQGERAAMLELVRKAQKGAP